MSGRPREFTDRKRELNRIRQARWLRSNREKHRQTMKDVRAAQKEKDRVQLEELRFFGTHK